MKHYIALAAKQAWDDYLIPGKYPYIRNDHTHKKTHTFVGYALNQSVWLVHPYGDTSTLTAVLVGGEMYPIL